MKAKMKTMLSMVMACMCTAFAGAQTVDSPWVGSTIENGGTYYVYNPKAKAFLSAGNNWGTQASLLQDGLPFVIEGSGEMYALRSVISNGGDSNYMTEDGWMDGARTELIIRKVNENTNLYTIAPFEGCYFADEASDSSTVVAHSYELTEDCYWQFLSSEEFYAGMENASVINPINVTSLLGCANFGKNNMDLDKWIGEPRPTVGGNVHSYCAEVYNSAFQLYQSISVPNGIYRITAQGFYRKGNPDVISPNDEVTATFYANTESVLLHNIIDEIDKVYQGISLNGGNIPNDMNDASTAFSRGLYQLDTLEVVVADNILTIGFKNDLHVDMDWTCFDNVQILYYGPANIENYLGALNGVRGEVNAYITALDTMGLAGIQTALSTEYAETESIDETSVDAITAEIQRLREALSAAQAGVKAYNDLSLSIYNYRVLVAEKPSEEFYAAITEAEAVYNNRNASADEYVAAYQALEEEYALYHVASIDLSTLNYDQEVWINEWIVGLNTTYHVACVYQCYNSDSVCVVPESFQYNGEEYTTIGLGRYDYGWNYVWGNSYMIQSVQLPSTLRFLGTYALTGCNLMQEIDIPEGVEYIGEQAFGSCESLTEIVLPESLETIGNYAFGWCNSLKSITIPESVTSIGNTAFSCCSSLTSITIPTGVTSIGDNAFESCVSLSEIVLPESLETIGHGAFNWCSSLKSITIPAGVTSIGGGIFNECTQLESIYCLGTTPPVLNDDMTYSERKPLVHVPEGCAASYRVANYWNNYLVIEGEGVTVDINVEKPGTLGEKVLEQVEYLYNVNHLVVSGVLNEADLARIRNAMPYLLTLDMTEVDMAVLPNNALYEHRNLREVSLPKNLTSIGDYAFCYCRSLTSVNVPDGVETIEDYAFHDCDRLEEFVCPLALKRISYDAFNSCDALKSVTFNEGLERLESCAFVSCGALTEIVLPSSLTYCDAPFCDCHNIQSVTCRALIPPYLQNNTDILCWVDKSNCVLYVPEWTINTYKLTLGWENFVNIEPLVGYLPENINVMGNVNLTLPESLPVDYRANVSLNYSENNWEYSSLTLNSEGECVLPVGKFHMVYDANVAYDHNTDWNYSTQSYYTTLINNTGMRADNVSITLYNRNDVWNFFSFPYDVKVSEIVPLYENSDFVIRKYSGMERANGNMANTWQNMTADSTLHAGEGYIWHSNRYIDDWDPYNRCGFEIPAVNNANKNLIFANDDRTVTLNEYLSEYSHNRSWNLIGNPYPAYYDTRAMDFAAPITVWNANNSTYYAYSPIDDEYILCPGEAFFVQRPVDTDAITFRADGRQTDRAVRNRAYAQTYTRSASERQVVNLTLSDGEKKDRTRFVINSAAARDYEMSRDANKFMSDDARIPQLYTIDGGVQYAINERPMDNGVVALGVRFGMKGSYTIALDTQVKGMSIVLVDKLTGIETDLMEGAYTFTAEAGTINNRFEVRMRADEENGDTTGLDSLNGQVQVKAAAGKIVVIAPYEAAIEVYDAEGQRIAAATTAATAFDVEPGVYVVKVQDTVHKVSVSR